MIKKISQSFIKDMIDYNAGRECGNLIRHKYVNDKFVFPSKAQALGSYFEYELTKLLTGVGSLPKDGFQPKAQMQKSGKEPYIEYVRANQNAIRVKEYFDKWKLKVIAAGKKKVFGRFEGTIDLLVEALEDGEDWKKGEVFIIDLKYSGLLDDKWTEFGWAWSDIQRDYHSVQAIHYHMITKGARFFYLVIAPDNVTDIKMLEVTGFTEERINSHKERANLLMADFQRAVQTGFIPYPELSKCLKCPLRSSCEDKAVTPKAIKVSI